MRLVADNLATAASWVDLIAGSVTTVGVIIAALWAYFKLVRGRTFRPRVEVAMSGEWFDDGGPLLHARVAIKNIGNSKLFLRPRGTGLRICVPRSEQPQPPSSLRWEPQKVFAIFAEHHWIEPNEPLSDDIVINLGVDRPVSVLLETRLVVASGAGWWSRLARRKALEINARAFVPAGEPTGRKWGLWRKEKNVKTKT